MFLDASVIIAILIKEPGWEEIVKRIEDRQGAFLVSPLVRFEAVLGLARALNRDPDRRTAAIAAATEAVDRFLADLDCREIAITPDIGTRALGAAATYGKAVGHAADLNFGDCFSYACAKVEAVPLIYKGNDFAETDLA